MLGMALKKLYRNTLKTITAWYKRKNPRKKASSSPSSSNEFKVAMHRGHMIASQYGIGDYARKVQTFVYTNVVPQFGDFNSVPWKICETKLIQWGQDICLRVGEAHMARNVQMFIVVGAIPSTYGPSNTRFFGSGGFSDYQDDSRFPVNVPAEMWTASCCTYEYTKDGRRYSQFTKSTAFWRENVPGQKPCERIDVDTLEEKLTPRGETRINLFPSSNECKKKKTMKDYFKRPVHHAKNLFSSRIWLRSLFAKKMVQVWCLYKN